MTVAEDYHLGRSEAFNRVIPQIYLHDIWEQRQKPCYFKAVRLLCAKLAFFTHDITLLYGMLFRFSIGVLFFIAAIPHL